MSGPHDLSCPDIGGSSISSSESFNFIFPPGNENLRKRERTLKRFEREECDRLQVLTLHSVETIPSALATGTAFVPNTASPHWRSTCCPSSIIHARAAIAQWPMLVSVHALLGPESNCSDSTNLQCESFCRAANASNLHLCSALRPPPIEPHCWVLPISLAWHYSTPDSVPFSRIPNIAIISDRFLLQSHHNRSTRLRSWKWKLNSNDTIRSTALDSSQWSLTLSYSRPANVNRNEILENVPAHVC